MCGSIQRLLRASDILDAGQGGEALATPTGPAPVRGVASISGLGTSSVTVNTNNAKVIINWQGFSIDLDEVTRFNQPSATAAVLNRIAAV